MENLYKVLEPDVKSLEDLELWKREFDALTYHQRVRSNELSIAKYGSDNISRYNLMKDKFNEKEFNSANFADDMNPTISSAPVLKEASVYDSILDNWDSICAKIEEAEGMGLIILIDTNNKCSIENYPESSVDIVRGKYDKFMSMSQNLRQLSNQTAQAITGYDNYTLYNTIISAYNTRFRDEYVRDDDIENPGVSTEYSPYFSPIEIDSMKKKFYDGPISDPYIQKFSRVYENTGKIDNEYQWCNKLEELFTLKETYYGRRNIGLINESILRLGWPPAIPFSREIAKETYKRH